MGTITVVGLGPADATLLAPATLDALRRHDRRFLRTAVHPAASAVVDAVTFDDVYEQAPDFATVYETIAERLVAAAAEGDLVYAVPGSPLVLERTVELLRGAEAAGRVVLDIVPAMSFLDVVWARLKVDPVESSVRLIDGHVFATAAAGRTGPLLVAHCHSVQVLSEIKLSLDDGPVVTVLQRLGSPDERIFQVPWHELDREVAADHLTSLWIPSMAAPVAAEFVRFEELVRRLRRECPWDREQTHSSLRQHLLEETHETLEALDARAALADDEIDADLDDHLAEELGDLLYQVFFHARVAEERGAFTVGDVARGVHDKLVVRHPHVFGAADGEVVEAGDAETVLGNWEAIKREEKGRASAMDGIPPALPALLLALKSQKRAAATGFDWDGGPEVAFADVEDELAEVRADPSEHEVGDLLFAAVQVARRLDVDPEAALRAAAARFQHRFREVERLAGAEGVDLATATQDRLGALWREAKRRETA